MKTFLLACLLAGVILAEARRPGKGHHKERMCDRLQRGCENGRRKITYCSWNSDAGEYETVEKPVACLMYAIKCSKNKDKAPLHKGKCGDCTEANVCRKPNGGGMMMGRKVCSSDGEEYDNMCKFAIARCEKYSENKTLLTPKSCRKAKYCENLEERCNNGTSRLQVTYCAWNEDNDDYETVTKGMACLLHTMKCRQEGDKLPLHKGECGNCTKANICKRPGKFDDSKVGEGTGGVIDDNDNDNDDDDDDDDDENNTVTVGGKSWKGKGLLRGLKKMAEKFGKKFGGRKGGKGHHKGGRKGGKGGKKRGRKVCDEDGNEYDNMCDFAVARCEKYAEDDEVLKPERCEKED